MVHVTADLLHATTPAGTPLARSVLEELLDECRLEVPRAASPEAVAESARMRLLLCSYGLGAHGEALRSLAAGTRAGIVPNATDQWPASPERHRRELDALAGAGLDATVLDLREHFGDVAGLGERLEALDVVWVLGGNTFVLARAMHASGFTAAAGALVRAGRLTFAGYSAGACIAGPDLQGIHLMDEPDAVPDGYDVAWPAPALGLLPWRIVPHWRSDHPESPGADVAVEHLLTSHLAFQTLRDGRALLVDGQPSSARVL